MKIRNSVITILIAIWFIFLSGCDNNVVYEQQVRTNPKGWHLDSLATFDILVNDSLVKYNLLLDLTFDNTYPYQNVYFFVDVIDPNHQQSRDTIECFLYNYIGQPFGKKQGDNTHLELMYRYNNFFPNTGVYTFNIQHAMRDTLLKGFCSVGLKLEEFSED